MQRQALDLVIGGVASIEDGEKRAAFLEEFTSQGYCGTKTNRGFYTYPEPANEKR